MRECLVLKHDIDLDIENSKRRYMKNHIHRFKLMALVIVIIFLGACSNESGITTRSSSQNSPIIPDSSAQNENIVWENVFTDGNAGKVNRSVVDSDGNAAVVFMPDKESRIHKINGNTGERIWTKTISNTTGFGISEINDAGRSDYIVSGGIGKTQERWVARLNGNDGSTIWSKTYNSTGDSGEFDAVRMTIVGSDGFIYGAGFIGANDGVTIFVIHGGHAMVMKIDPENGNEVWTHTNPNTDYALAVVEATDGNLYYGSTMFEDNLTLTKLNKSGAESWTRSLANTTSIIPSDMDISLDNTLYFGGHAGRETPGESFDYSCVKMDLEANIEWIKYYANPRGYSLDYIRNELYGIKARPDGIYMFGGTGDENESYSETNPPFLPSDTWNGWVLIIDLDGNIIRSNVFSHAGSMTATEYGSLTDNGYMIFNDTDAYGDSEVGVMKIRR